MDEHTRNSLKSIQAFMVYYGSYVDSALSGHMTESELTMLFSRMIVSTENGFLGNVRSLKKYLYSQAEKKRGNRS